MDKIKAFFQNKIVKIVEWILLAVIVVGLIIGGATTEVINSGVALVFGIVSAVVLLCKFISDQLK